MREYWYTPSSDLCNINTGDYFIDNKGKGEHYILVYRDAFKAKLVRVYWFDRMFAKVVRAIGRAIGKRGREFTTTITTTTETA